MQDANCSATLVQCDLERHKFEWYHERDKLLFCDRNHHILSLKHSETHIINPTQLYVCTVKLHVSDDGVFNSKHVEFF